jgi:hypothetical protein
MVEAVFDVAKVTGRSACATKAKCIAGESTAVEKDFYF